jgi:hypothetical protein
MFVDIRARPSTDRTPMRSQKAKNTTLTAAVVIAAAVAVTAFVSAASGAAASSSDRHRPTTTTQPSTTTIPSTTTTTPTSSLSDSGAANCASDGGTLVGAVCNLADGTLHQQYETLIASSGGSGPTPYLFKVVGGSLPPGLQLPPDYAIGEHGTIIGGTPTARGTFAFTIQVTDGAGDTATGNFSLTIV